MSLHLWQPWHCCFQLPGGVHDRVQLLSQRVRKTAPVDDAAVSIVRRRLAHGSWKRATIPGWHRGPRYERRITIVHGILKPLLGTHKAASMPDLATCNLCIC